MIFFLNNLGDIAANEAVDFLGSILNTLWLILCGIVYDLLSYLFVIFSKLITIDILTEGKMEEIYSRATMIFTIVMTFYIVFEFVKYTVSPNQITDKEKGAMPLFGRVVISILLLAFVPKIFTIAMNLQSRIINSNVFPNTILGTSKVDGGIAGYGREFVGDVVSAFIRIDCDASTQSCEEVIARAENLVNGFKYSNLAFADSIMKLWAEDLFTIGIDFDGLLALIFGGFILYVLFLYCKDVALRYVQLIFLQVISPIAIISYIGPKKDGMFQKWIKQCTTTYLDIFIRLAVLYFLILIMKILGEQYNIFTMTRNGGENLTVGIWEYLFLVGGLFTFMKKAPKLLQELFPTSGAASIGFGFSGKERKGILGGAANIAASAVGAFAGAKRGIDSTKSKDIFSAAEKADNSKLGKLKRLGTAANVIGRSTFAGGRAGYKNGIKGIGDARRTAQEKVQSYEDIVSRGGTVLGHDFRGGYYQDEQARLKLEIDGLEKKVKLNDAQATFVKSAKAAQDSAEDRSRKKIESREQKIAVALESDIKYLINQIGANQLSKYGIQMQVGQKTSEIYSMLEAKANSAKATAAAFNQELVKAEVEGDTEKIERLKNLVAEKEAEEVELKILTEKALKELERYAFTRTLRGDIGTIAGIEEKEDAVLSSNIATVKQVLENLRNNAETNEEAKEKLRIALSDELFNKLMNYETEVTDFDIFDAIQGKLTNYASSLNDENSATKEQIRHIQESTESQIANANSSGKK